MRWKSNLTSKQKESVTQLTSNEEMYVSQKIIEEQYCIWRRTRDGSHPLNVKKGIKMQQLFPQKYENSGLVTGGFHEKCYVCVNPAHICHICKYCNYGIAYLYLGKLFNYYDPSVLWARWGFWIEYVIFKFSYTVGCCIVWVCCDEVISQKWLPEGECHLNSILPMWWTCSHPVPLHDFIKMSN